MLDRAFAVILFSDDFWLRLHLRRRAGKYLYSRVLFAIFSLFFALPKPLRDKTKTQNTIEVMVVETIRKR